ASAVSGSTISAGGEFTRSGSLAAAGVAGLFPTPVSPPTTAVLAPNGGERVNVGSIYRLSWNATTSAPGVQSVDLYLSRGGAGGPPEVLGRGGPHHGQEHWTRPAPPLFKVDFMVEFAVLAREH